MGIVGRIIRGMVSGAVGTAATTASELLEVYAAVTGLTYDRLSARAEPAAVAQG